MKTEVTTNAGNCPVDGTVRPVAWMRADGMKSITADEKDAWEQAGRPDLVEEYDSPLYSEGALNDLRICLQSKVEDLKAERNRARLAGELEATKRERERCAKVAEDFLTKGRSPLGRSVAAAIRGA